MSVSKGTENMSDGIDLSTAENSALKDLQELLHRNGFLEIGKPIPNVDFEKINLDDGRLRCNFGASVHKGKVFALSLRQCGLTTIPQSIGRLTALQQIDLTGNHLASLPDSFEELLHMKKLYLDENHFASLPNFICNLIDMEEIHIEENRLTQLPERFGHLTKLKVLSIRSNQLDSLPESIW